MECYCYLRSVQVLLSDGKTPHARRFGEQVCGAVIPFGSIVEYHPISAKEQSRLDQFDKKASTRNLSLHQFGKKVLLGLFSGYALYVGRIWKGDILVADMEEQENLDVSEILIEDSARRRF